MSNPIIYSILTLITSGIIIKYSRTTTHCKPFALAQKVTGNPPVIAFDLNGVVLKFSPLRAMRTAIVYKNKLKLLRAICSPSLIWQVLKTAYQGAVVEQAILQMPDQHPEFAELVPLALQMANEQVLVQGTIQLIQDLKNAGCQVYAFSNLGEKSAQILNQKYPALFKLFQGVLVTSAQDQYLMKPDPAAFDKFLSQFQLDPNNLIFIDDKPKNILAARRCGITGIRFVTACQCRRELQKLLP